MLQRIQTSALLRHVHRDGYAALVLSGGYEEAGDFGRFRVRAGQVVLHEAFEGHLDRFPASGAVVLNLPLHAGAPIEGGPCTVEDPDAVVRLAEVDPQRAATRLLASVSPVDLACADWPDLLARDLLRDPDLALGVWGETAGLSAWTVSRGFARIFGLTPVRFRARVRARRAWNAIRSTGEPLATVAAQLGFADQSHMTRSVSELTGRSPQSWRQGCKSVQDA
jgi:AraC-like DNA-binding protein